LGAIVALEFALALEEVLMQVAPETLTSSSPNDFVRLIERIRLGDESALEKLLTAVAVPLRRMANRLIGSSLRPHLDADDLVQAVSLILWRGLRSGKFEIVAVRQLMRLAAVLLKRQAAKAVQRIKPSMTATMEGDMQATLADQPLRSAQGVAQKAERDDQIRHLMKRVSDEDRAMLQLLLLGHSIAAAARLLDLEPATLRMRLSRLRVRLKKVPRVDEMQG
jgi:RNA polymerase sigma factor (sigma-70 family)